MSQLSKKFINASSLEGVIDQVNNIFQELYSRLDSPVIFTRDGGLAVPYKNIEATDLKRGELVALGTTEDDSVVRTAANAINAIGVVYETIKAGEVGLIVTALKGYVLLKNATASVAGNWVVPSDVAGRADATATNPAGGTLQAHATHFGEVGHCEETKSAGTDVLALCSLHFN